MVAIRPAREDDLDLLPTIEAMAAARFREVGLDWIAERPPEEPAVYEPFLRKGGLVVAAAPDDTAVGFIAIGTVDDEGYIDEINVLPGFGRQGVGNGLIAAAEAIAAGRGQARVRLTTFRDVPWNAPWYRRRGFREIEPSGVGEALQKIWRRQADLRGLAPRLLMEKRLPPHE